MLPHPIFLPLLHPGGTRAPFHPDFCPWLKPCGGPPPPPGPFADAIVTVDAANVRAKTEIAAMRGSDAHIFASCLYFKFGINVSAEPTFPHQGRGKVPDSGSRQRMALSLTRAPGTNLQFFSAATRRNSTISPRSSRYSGR